MKGVCIEITNDFKCLCYKNYSGKRCEISILRSEPKCKPGTCMNNGKCIESDMIEGFVCKCPRNFNGLFCERSICSSIDCGNNGTCHLKKEGGLYCHCSDGSIAENCKSHPCMANVCGSNGICVRQGYSYYCDCKAG